VDFIELLDEVGLLSCLARHICLYNILENRVDFCSHLHLLWFTPFHREIFLVTELTTILGNESSFLGFGVFFSLDFSHSY
jgi:hypothetical protein